MKDRRECPDCRELLVGECQCERRDTLRTRRGLLSTAENAGKYRNYAEVDAYRESVEEAERAIDPGGPLARSYPEVTPEYCRDLRRRMTEESEAIRRHRKRKRAPRCPNYCAHPIGSLVFAFLALLALASPVAASPLCAAAIDHDWGATSTPEPSWALKTCELVASAADRHDVREALVLSVASVESDFRPYVCSSSGACGALQVKQRYHCRTLFGWRACLTARALVDAGVRHLAELLDEMPERQALRCYNAGRRGCSSSPKAGARYAAAVASVERRIR